MASGALRHDPAAAATRLIALLNDSGPVYPFGYIPRAPEERFAAIVAWQQQREMELQPKVLELLLYADLSSEQVMGMLGQLDSAHVLSRFLDLRRSPAIRQYLRDKRVPLAYIVANWQLSSLDIVAFTNGLLVGAGEDLINGLRLLADILSAPLAKTLAEIAGVPGIISESHAEAVVASRNEFQRQIHDVFARLIDIRHPVLSALRVTESVYTGMQKLLKEYQENVEELEFFAAGRAAGKLILLIATLPSIVRTIISLPRLIATISTLTYLRFLELVSNQVLREFIRIAPPRPALAVAGRQGQIVLVESDGWVTAISPDGTPHGKILLSSIEDLTSQGLRP